MFYKNNIKIIPRNLDNFLTPLALAVWFLNNYVNLDKQNKRIALYKISFKDLQYLSCVLKKKYNLDTAIYCDNNASTISIKSTCYNIFVNKVKPHLLPSLHHRLNHGDNRLILSNNTFAYSTFNPSCKLGLKVRDYSTKK